VTTPSTVLHRGYIAQELMKQRGSDRYEVAERILHEWAAMDPEGLLEAPERVAWAIEEIRLMKLEAFAAAGVVYRAALARVDAFRELCDRFGPPPKGMPQTAIVYLEPPKGMPVIDFTAQEFPWVV
jgi:hypothetical protein